MKPRSLRRRRASSARRSSVRPWHLSRILRGIELCEPRWMLATDVHVISGASGAGTLDAQFLAAGGTLSLAATDVGGDTLSTGALTSIASNHDIIVNASNLIDFNLSADLSLPTATGHLVDFSTSTGGDIKFLSVANTLSTAGGEIEFQAGANLTLENLNSGGGDVMLLAGLASAGNLAAQGILTSSSGNITLQATNASGGTITQTGTASGLAVSATATGNVVVDSLRGTTVSLTSNTASVDSQGANAIQASSQLTITAATGITVNTEAASLQATNNTAGNINVTQLASPAQTLNLNGSGVVNSAPSGSITIDNLGASLTHNATNVQSSNGNITLAATDLQLNGPVSSGTARAILTSSAASGKIDVGTNTPGSVGLTQTELNNVTAGLLQIGTPTVVAINVSAAITSPATWNTLTLIDGGGITEAAAGALTVPNLRMSAVAPVAMTNTNDVGTLAADIFDGFSFSNGTNLLTVGIVDGDTGVSTNGANIHLIADDMDLAQRVTTANTGAGVVNLEPFTTTRIIDLGTNSAGNLGLDNNELNNVTAEALRIGSGNFSGDITVSAAISPVHLGALSLVTTGTGTITSQNPFDTITVNNGTGGLAVQAATAVALDAANQIGSLAAAISGAGNGFDFHNSAAFHVSTVDGVAGITTATGAGETTVLTADGSVTQDAGANITTTNLRLQGAGGYTLSSSGNDAATLAASVTNGVSYTDANDLIVSGQTPGIDEVQTITLPTLTGTGTFTLSFNGATTGPLSVSSPTLVSDIQSALDGLSTIGGVGGSVVVFQSTSNSMLFSVTFEGALSDTNVPLMIPAGTGIPSPVVTTVTDGESPATGVTTNGADINIAASAVTSGTTLTVSQPVNSTGAANVTLGGDRMALGAAVNAHAGIVTLQPTTAGRAVDLGTNSNTAHLGILQTDLSNLTAGIVRVGNFTNSGNLTITAPVSDAGLGFSTLSLLTGLAGGISQNAGATLTVTNLQASGASGVTLNENNVVSTLAGASDSGAFSFVDSANLTVDNVDPGLGSGFGSGIITPAQPVSLTVNLLNDLLTVNRQIDTTHSFGGPATGGANVNLAADNMALNNNSPSSVVNAGTGGAMTLTPFTPSNTIAVGGPDAAGQLGIDDNDLSNVTAKVVRIGSTAQTGAVTIDGTINTHAGYGALDLVATGAGTAITQTTGSISVANLALQATSGIGSAGAIQLVGPINVAFHNSTSNNVQVTSTGALTINSVDGVTTSANSASGGTVTLSASSPMTFAVNTSSSSTISAATTETASETSTPLSPPDDNITVNSGVTVESTGGNVVFTSGDHIITQAASSVKSDTGAVTFTVGMGDVDSDAATSISGLVSASTPPTVTGGSSLTVNYTAGASLPQGLTFNAGVAGATLTTTDAGGTTPHAYNITGTSIVRDGAAAISYNTTNTNVSAVAVTGADSPGPTGDTFNVTPSATVTFTIHGGLPTPPAKPGDTLNLSSYSGATISQTFSPTTGFSGAWTFTGGNQPVHFDGMETLGGTIDLAITKTDNSATPGSAVPGTSLTYTIVASNIGATAVSGASVTDAFPSGFNGASFTATATGGATGFTASGSGNISDTVNLPVGSTITYVVSGTIPSSATGTLSNTATVAVPSGVTDTNPANNTSTDTLTLTPKADLKITKTDNSATPGSAVPGTSLHYTIVVSNLGPSDAAGATVADTFPSGFTGASFTATATGGATGFTASGSGNISDTVNLPAGSTITYVVTGTIGSSATGTLTNTATVTAPASVTDTNTANNTATDTLALTPKADLKITKTDNSTTPGSAVPGTSVHYTIVVSNLGPSDATGATVADTFPSGFTGASFTATATGGATGFTATGTGNISDTVNLPVGSTITYVVTGTIGSSATGTLSNTAMVTAPASVTDTNPANNTATDALTLTPKADLKITKTDNSTTPGSAVPGTSLTYTIVVSNLGPSAVSGASVADTLPTALTGGSFTATATGGATGFTASGSGNLNDTVNLPVGSTITYVVTGTIRSSATGTMSNTATVTAPAGVTEINTANNTSTDVLTLTPKADLKITKTDNSMTPGSAVPGTSLKYTVVVSNLGPSDASGASVADTLPTAFTGSSFTATATGGATGFTASGSGNLSDTVNLPAGSTITYVVTGTIRSSATGTLSNTATVTAPATVPDTNTANNTSTDTLTLTPKADLKITKTDNSTTPGSAVPGTSLKYTIVVTNLGPSDVTGASVADTFPSGFTGGSFTATASGGATGFTASGAGNLSDTVNLPAGSTITYIVTGALPASATGTLSNTAKVTAPAGVTEINTANNTATDTLTLTPTANVTITKTDNSFPAGSIVAGSNLSYTIVVGNTGPSDVSGATLADALPAVFGGAKFTATASGGATGFTASGSGNISDTLNLPVGSTVTYIVSGRVSFSASGALTNSVTLASPAGVVNSGQAGASDTVSVAPVGYLAGVPGDGSVATFVHNLYRELLGREPETAGQTFWNNFVQQHNTAATRQDAVDIFLNSPEYKSHYITTLYAVFLARGPEASGLQYWTGQMGTPGTPGTNGGGSDEKFILSRIVASDEFYSNAGGTSQGFAQALYQDLLGRTSGSGEVPFWASAVDAQPNNRDGVVRQFLTAPEAEHKLLDSFFSAPGGTASNPLPVPGAPVGANADDLAVATGDGWENLYLEGPSGSSPQAADAFYSELAGGTAWDDVQSHLLATDQFYTNANQPIT